MNTPHPTSLRSATFSLKGRRSVRAVRSPSSPSYTIGGGEDERSDLLPLREKVAERSEVG
jgi:hypothetical protein